MVKRLAVRSGVGGFEVVHPKYAALRDRALVALRADDRVVDVRVAGSLASGNADAWSDLDILVVVRQDDHGSFLDDWQAWLAAIDETVFAFRPIAASIVNAISADGVPFDIVVITDTQQPPQRSVAGYTVGFLAKHRFPDQATALEYAVHEQFRGLVGPLPKFLNRGDHVDHFMGIGHTVSLLTAVLLAESSTPPPVRTVADALSAEQQEVIASLPPVSATYDSLLEFELAIAREVVTRARPLFERYGLEWPAALEAVAVRRLRDALGVDTSDWLTTAARDAPR